MTKLLQSRHFMQHFFSWNEMFSTLKESWQCEHSAVTISPTRGNQEKTFVLKYENNFLQKNFFSKRKFFFLSYAYIWLKNWHVQEQFITNIV